MTTKNRNTPPNAFCWRRGFSLIDVMVAIIVLATALLALAALQGALTRNSADTRSRSQIAAYSEGIIEQLRATSYDSIAASTITPSNGSTATIQQNQAYNAQTAAGVSNLNTVVTTQEYYGNTSGTGGSFTTTAPSNCCSSTPRYKKISVSTTWTDASGQARTLKMDTMVSPITIDTTDTSLVSQSLAINGTASPIVREYNPGATAGVIPIAVGTGQQSAATNPKPELLSLNGNNSAVVGTSFNVLTYQNPDANNNTVIQKRIDTLVIACSCKYGGPVTSDGNSDLASVMAQPYRPTYWNGSVYTDPDPVNGATSSNTGLDTSAVQSTYCDVCCRDHNDSASDDIKFDPWNKTNDYAHYRYDNTTSPATLVEVTSSDTTDAFMNDCRLIRVNGRYTTATDLNNYFFGLLATYSPATAATTATTPIPDTVDTADFGTGGAVAQYQAFILNYLESNINSLTSNVIPSVASTATVYGNSTYNLDVPDTIGISYDSADTDYRYLHARGLYIDYLEPDAVTAINNSVTTCPYSTTSDCYLPILPFTTINLTEIAKWEVTTTPTHCTSPSNTVSVNNSEIIGETFDSKAGVVQAESCANSSDEATVQASITNSNSGIATNGADFASPVDPDDADSANAQSDTQDFEIVSTNSYGGGNVGATIYLTPAAPNNVLPQLSKGYQSTYPSVSWDIDSVTAPAGSQTACSAVASGNGGGTQLNDYACPTIPTLNPPPLTGATLTVKLQNYNYAYTSSGANPCWSGHNTSIQYCANYSVDTTNILVNGTSVSGATVAVTNDGNIGNSTTSTTPEESTVTLPSQSLDASNTISIGFLLQSTTSTSYTCGGTSNHTATYNACD